MARSQRIDNHRGARSYLADVDETAVTDTSDSSGGDPPARDRPPRFEIGRVVGESLSVFRLRWRAIVVFALAIWAIAVAQSLTHIVTYQHGSHNLRAFAEYWAFAIAFVCIGWLKDAAIVAAALERPGDERPMVHAARGSLRVFLPLLPFHALAAGPALIWNAWSSWALTLAPARLIQIDFAMGAVFWLYGLVVTALFGLVTPAILVERGSLIDSLRRSSALLSGGRWRFVGLSILMDLVGALPATFGGAMVALLFARLPRLTSAPGAGRYLQIEGVAIGLLGSLATALWMVMTAVSYREFRRLREGAPHDEVAAIFA